MHADQSTTIKIQSFPSQSENWLEMEKKKKKKILKYTTGGHQSQPQTQRDKPKPPEEQIHYKEQ
jgi:hypothetical protein